MHFHIDQTGLFTKDFFHIQGVPGNNLAPIQKSSLGCKVCQMRSWGGWLEAQISPFMMFMFSTYL